MFSMLSMVLVQNTTWSVLHYSIQLKMNYRRDDIDANAWLRKTKTHNYLYRYQRKAAGFHTQNRNQDKTIRKSEIG